ncbi:MAG: Smr/MutS family protein [Sulfuriferula sp.]
MRAGKSILPAAVDPDDLALFQQAVSGVQPIADTGRIVPSVNTNLLTPKSFLQDERQALQDSLSDYIGWDDGIETGEELAYIRTGLRRDTLRKLRRGHWVLQAELDLHGMISVEARQAVAAFLADCGKRGKRCVRIIHGKGLGSKNKEPILRTKVKHWLMQKDEVLAFCQARTMDGGSGAVVVLLKSS